MSYVFTGEPMREPEELPIWARLELIRLRVPFDSIEMWEWRSDRSIGTAGEPRAWDCVPAWYTHYHLTRDATSHQGPCSH